MAVGTRTCLGLLLVGLLASEARAELTVGVNVGWIDGKHGRDLTSDYDPEDWRRVFRRARESGAPAARVWLHEGPRKEGTRWEGHRPVGVDPAFLNNLREVVDIAREERLQVYWTLVAGNWGKRWGRGNVNSHRHYNILTNRYGYGDLFRERVIGPVLDVIRARPEVTWGIDIMNEVQGSVRAWFWPDRWYGARRFLRVTAAFIHQRAPGIPIAASSGHHTAGRDILDGRFDGLGLDRLDVHVYTDGYRIPLGRRLAHHARAQGTPIVLGEFGQKKEADDPALQARVAASLLHDADRHHFVGAFIWRVEDPQPKGVRFSLYDGDTPRPVTDVLRRFARLQREREQRRPTMLRRGAIQRLRR